MTPPSCWVLAALSMIPFASFAWAVRRHFLCPGPMPMAMQFLSAVSLGAYISFIIILLTMRQTPPPSFLVPGIIMFMAGTGIFWWAIAASSTIRLNVAYKEGGTMEILTSGPYALIRHPFYLAYMLFWTGTGLIAGGLQWFFAAVFMLWYVLLARSEERRLLARQRCDGSYVRYQGRTGMFLPSIGRQPPW